MVYFFFGNLWYYFGFTFRVCVVSFDLILFLFAAMLIMLSFLCYF